MKKIYLLLITISCIFLTGCGKNNESDVLSDLSKELNGNKNYILTARLEIVNNDDVYNYDVQSAYKKDSFYRISLTNTANNHEQIILKNDDGVYVLTPSLNKSFKFQSDWPYNNSQIYLLQSIINDLENDNNRTFEKNDKNYVFTSSVNYPNNRHLVKQKVVFDDSLGLKEVQVLNDNDIPIMTLKVKNIDYSPKFGKNFFELEEIMSTFNNLNETLEAGVIDDIIYPLVLPEGTKLTSEEKVNLGNGERVILTFDGDKPFTLVEETVATMDEFTVIPTIGEPFMFMDSVGVLSDNSITFTTSSVEYYIVSDVLNQSELIEIANSINALPAMK